MSRSAARGVQPLIKRPEDRNALSIWLLTRVTVLVTAVVASAHWSFGDLGESFLERWTQWDTDLLIEIARYGYGGDPADTPDAGLPAFFPGFPLLLRLVHVVVPSWQLAALLISFVAGGVATCALARLAVFEADRGAPALGSDLGGQLRPSGPLAGVGAGTWAVLAMLVSPAAVFLFAGYSEALFLALALPAWLCARQGRWELAALCATAAATVRITGVFLAVALIVEFLVQRTNWRRLPMLALPFAGPLAYVLYQWRRTGDWLAWQHAQAKGWGRDLVTPWQAWSTTWDAAFGDANQFSSAFRVELVAAVIGVLLLGWLLARRRWAESMYVGLQLAALLMSAFYLSIGRATLLWWPMWLAIGALALRRPMVYAAYIAIALPLLILQVITFTAGEWAG